MNIEFTRARNVDMSAWLVCTWINGEVNEQCAKIDRCAHDRLTVVPWSVVAEEWCICLGDDIITLDCDLERIDCLSIDRNIQLFACLAMCECFHAIGPWSCDQVGSGLHCTRRARDSVHCLVCDCGEIMPVAVLIWIGRASVERWAHTNVDHLSWPFQLRKQPIFA